MVIFGKPPFQGKISLLVSHPKLNHYFNERNLELISEVGSPTHTILSKTSAANSVNSSAKNTQHRGSILSRVLASIILNAHIASDQYYDDIQFMPSFMDEPIFKVELERRMQSRFLFGLDIKEYLSDKIIEQYSDIPENFVHFTNDKLFLFNLYNQFKNGIMFPDSIELNLSRLRSYNIIFKKEVSESREKENQISEQIGEKYIVANKEDNNFVYNALLRRSDLMFIRELTNNLRMEEIRDFDPLLVGFVKKIYKTSNIPLGDDSYANFSLQQYHQLMLEIVEIGIVLEPAEKFVFNYLFALEIVVFQAIDDYLKGIDEEQKQEILQLPVHVFAKNLTVNHQFELSSQHIKQKLSQLKERVNNLFFMIEQYYNHPEQFESWRDLLLLLVISQYL